MASKVASLIIRLTDELSGPAGQASKALQGLGKAGDNLSRLKTASTGLDQLGAKMRKARTEVERAAKDLAAAQKKVDFFSRSKASGSANYAGFKASGEVDAAQARLRVAKATFAAAQRQLDSLKTTFDGQKAAVRGLSAALGAAGKQLKDVRSAEQGIASAAGAANAALAKQPALFSLASQRAAGLAKAYRDVAAGMSAAGRQAAAAAEANRKLLAGMGAAGRQGGAVPRRAILPHEGYRPGRPSGSLAAGAPVAHGNTGGRVVEALEGAGVAELTRRTYERARDGYLEMDEAVRRQRAVMGIDEGTQKPLYRQALRIGQDTRFSNADVVKAQTRVASSLPAHLKTTDVISAITENAKDYALALGTTMDEGSEAVISRIKGRRYDLSTPEAAAASAKHAANSLVQFAKTAGADHHDLMGYGKFGYAPGEVMGFSEDFSDALAASLKRLGYEGAMAGTFVRAAATKLTVPTDKGRMALAASGYDHDKYVEPGHKMSVDNLDKMVRLKFGKELTDEQKKRIADVMNDEDAVGERADFVPQVSAVLQETLAGKTKDGKVKAQDAAKIAKLVNDYYTLTSGKVRSQDLMMDIIRNGLTPQLAKYLFGTEHGGRALGLRPEMVEKDMETFKNTPQDRASKFGADVNAGFYGAYQRMIGSFETLYMRLAQVNDGPLTTFYDKLGNAVDTLSNLPDKTLQFGTAVAGATAGLLTLKGILATLSLLGVQLNFGWMGLLARLGIPAAAVAGPAALVNAAGGRHQPEELVRMRDQLSELNKSLERQNETVYRKQSQGDDATDAITRRDATLAKIKELTAAIEKAEAAAAKAGEQAGQSFADGIREKAPEAGKAGEQAGQNAGQGVAKGIEKESPKVEEKAKAVRDKISEIFADPIKVTLNLDTAGVTTAAAKARSTYVSLSGGGDGFGGGAARLSRGGRRGRVGAVPDAGADETPEAGYTGNDGRRAARSGMSTAGRENIASWLDFLQKAREQGGLGLDADKARAMVAMMQGESGLNLDPAARGDWQGRGANRRPTAFGTVQWREDRFEGLKALAEQMGVPWTDRGAQQAWMRKEMLEGRYRGAFQRILAARDGNEALMRGVSDYENPQKHALAYQIRKPFLDRLRRDALAPKAIADAQARPAYPPPGPGYGVPLHKGGTGLSRYTDQQLLEMQQADEARRKAAASPPTADQIEAARQRIQQRYAPKASPGATPGLTGSGVPAIAPKANTGGLDALGTKADGAKDKLTALGGVSVNPQVSTGNLDALIAKANAALAALQRIPGAVASANASLASVSPAAGAGGSSGKVRAALSDNFA